MKLDQHPSSRMITDSNPNNINIASKKEIYEKLLSSKLSEKSIKLQKWQTRSNTSKHIAKGLIFHSLGLIKDILKTAFSIFYVGGNLMAYGNLKLEKKWKISRLEKEILKPYNDETQKKEILLKIISAEESLSKRINKHKNKITAVGKMFLESLAGIIMEVTGTVLFGAISKAKKYNNEIDQNKKKEALSEAVEAAPDMLIIPGFKEKLEQPAKRISLISTILVSIYYGISQICSWYIEKGVKKAKKEVDTILGAAKEFGENESKDKATKKPFFDNYETHVVEKKPEEMEKTTADSLEKIKQTIESQGHRIEKNGRILIKQPDKKNEDKIGDLLSSEFMKDVRMFDTLRSHLMRENQDKSSNDEISLRENHTEKAIINAGKSLRIAEKILERKGDKPALGVNFRAKMNHLLDKMSSFSKKFDDLSLKDIDKNKIKLWKENYNDSKFIIETVNDLKQYLSDKKIDFISRDTTQSLDKEETIYRALEQIEKKIKNRFPIDESARENKEKKIDNLVISENTTNNQLQTEIDTSTMEGLYDKLKAFAAQIDEEKKNNLIETKYEKENKEEQVLVEPKKIIDEAIAYTRQQMELIGYKEQDGLLIRHNQKISFVSENTIEKVNDYMDSLMLLKDLKNLPESVMEKNINYLKTDFKNEIKSEIETNSQNINEIHRASFIEKIINEHYQPPPHQTVKDIIKQHQDRSQSLFIDRVSKESENNRSKSLLIDRPSKELKKNMPQRSYLQESKKGFIERLGDEKNEILFR